MLPNLVVIGAQKCGTSALHYYLGQHPEIWMSKPKELNFFIKKRNWERGLDWYESHFRAERKVLGEASPNYTNYPRFKGVAHRMHTVLPDARLIYMVRDPIDRIVSAYLHNRNKGRIDAPLEEVVTARGSTYLRRSRYHRQVRRFMRYYPKSQLLIVEREDLLDERRETLAGVFRFLGVDDAFWTPKYEQLRHETPTRRSTTMGRVGERVSPDLARRVQSRVTGAATVERPLVSEELRERLATKLKPDTDRFREFAGREFAHWSV